MAGFVLLLKSGNFEGYSPEEMQSILEKYLGWANHLRSEGRYLGGEELKGGGLLLKMDGKRVIDGPFTETKESVGGFFVIEAADLQEAIEISRGCPHLLYSGEIELREIIPH